MIIQAGSKIDCLRFLPPRPYPSGRPKITHHAPRHHAAADFRTPIGVLKRGSRNCGALALLVSIEPYRIAAFIGYSQRREPASAYKFSDRMQLICRD